MDKIVTLQNDIWKLKTVQRWLPKDCTAVLLTTSLNQSWNVSLMRISGICHFWYSL